MRLRVSGVILGIDAAWTAGQPSGVALLDTHLKAKCLIAAPSYAAFLRLARGGALDWHERQPGGEAPVAELLSASRALVGKEVDVVAIDMPVSREPISGRRVADQAVAREFGGRWCSTHSPGKDRPGALGERLTQTFSSFGYPIATKDTPPGTCGRLIEVYPHPALLFLLRRNRRIPYKVAKMRKYWPQASDEERRIMLLSQMHAIEAALATELGQLPFKIPFSDHLFPTWVLKAYEDTLDGVVCAWVGSHYLQRRAVPLGDASAAVWCPQPERI